MISAVVSLFMVYIMINQGDIGFGLPVAMVFFGIVCSGSVDSESLYEKFDSSDPSCLEEQAVVDDGEITPSNVQYLSRRDIVPALERAESVISSHLESLQGADVGEEFECSLLRFFARRENGSVANTSISLENSMEVLEPTIVEATAVPDHDDTGVVRFEGGLETTVEVVDRVPLVSSSRLERLRAERKKRGVR